MKLTDEALDYPDAMWPPRENNRIKISPRLQKLLDEADAAEKARKERDSGKPSEAAE